MNINSIIEKHYDELHSFCTTDKVISLGRTEEDILQDVCITAMKKYKEKDIDEKTGVDYLKLTLWTEQHFQMQRKKKERILYVDNLEDFDIST